jgi:hypothetical protein
VRDGIDEKPFYINYIKPHHTPRELSTLFMSTIHAVLQSLLQASPLSSPSLSRTNYGVGLTEILTPKDSRRFDQRLPASKEIEGLARRGRRGELSAQKTFQKRQTSWEDALFLQLRIKTQTKIYLKHALLSKDIKTLKSSLFYIKPLPYIFDPFGFYCV